MSVRERDTECVCRERITKYNYCVPALKRNASERNGCEIKKKEEKWSCGCVHGCVRVGGCACV